MKEFLKPITQSHCYPGEKTQGAELSWEQVFQKLLNLPKILKLPISCSPINPIYFHTGSPLWVETPDFPSVILRRRIGPIQPDLQIVFAFEVSVLNCQQIIYICAVEDSILNPMIVKGGHCEHKPLHCLSPIDY